MNELEAQLKAAAEAMDWQEITRICDLYIREIHATECQPNTREWSGALTLLRANRRYDDLTRVADALLSCEVNAPLARRALAQALVDQGQPATARLLFESLAEAPDATSHDRWEARGGLARCLKDMGLRATTRERRHRLIDTAFALYVDAYTHLPEVNYWHAINAVALGMLAEREGFELPARATRPHADPRPIAHDLIRELGTDAVDPWVNATLVEAHLALGHAEDALEATDALVRHPAANDFVLASLERQLTHVWHLDDQASPGREILQALRARILLAPGGRVTLTQTQVARDRAPLADTALAPLAEKVFGAVRFKTLGWYKLGLERCSAVAQILEEGTSAPVGTGFLVSAADIQLADEGVLLVTNAHVLPDAVRPGEATVVFRTLAQPREFRVAEVVWTSGVENLDVTIVRLDATPEGVVPLPLAHDLPSLNPTATPRAYLIGHPLGLETPQFSLQDNAILDYDADHLHYRSPSELGSSGSPVFDDQWRLIGIHRAGSSEMPRLNNGLGVYEANEATTVRALVEALRCRWGNA